MKKFKSLLGVIAFCSATTCGMEQNTIASTSDQDLVVPKYTIRATIPDRSCQMVQTKTQGDDKTLISESSGKILIGEQISEEKLNDTLIPLGQLIRNFYKKNWENPITKLDFYIRTTTESETPGDQPLSIIVPKNTYADMCKHSIESVNIWVPHKDSLRKASLTNVFKGDVDAEFQLTGNMRIPFGTADDEVADQKRTMKELIDMQSSSKGFWGWLKSWF